MKPYDPKNWYWRVAGDQTKVYSSASGDYVPVNDAAFKAWVSDGGLTTSIDTEDNLAEVLANASVRPVSAAVLDKYKDSQASKLTLEIVAKVLFNHENRVRALENKAPITAAQFINTLKAML